MARLLLDLGASVEGIGSTTLRIRCPEVVKDEPDAALVGRLRGSVLLLGPLLARRGRAHLAPPGGDFPTRRTIATHLEALESMGARIAPGRRTRARGPRRAQAHVDLSVRGVGDRHGNGAARRRRGEGRHRDTARGVRTARRRAVHVPPEAWRRCQRRRHIHHPHRRRDAPPRRRASAVGRLHRSRKLGGRCRGDRRRNRRRRRPRDRYGGGRRRSEAAARPVRDARRRLPGGAVAAAIGRADHHRTLAGIPERSDQPRDGARDASGRSDARARLAVRAAAVRARADERR